VQRDNSAIAVERGNPKIVGSDVVPQLRCKDGKKAFRGDACIVAHGICLLDKNEMVMVWFPAYPVMGTASFAGKTKKARSRCGMSTTGLDGSIIYVKHKTTALCGGFV
jgi:hypothetical protein